MMQGEQTSKAAPNAAATDAVPADNCANCGAPLTGPYCAMCGQHARSSARSLSELCQDCVHVITHADGRFWLTIRALLLSPGKLTREYFLDHRQRYLPPVRLYFILSILFFALSEFGHSDLKTVIVVAPTDSAEVAAAQTQALAEAKAACSQSEAGEPELAQKLRAQCLAEVDNDAAKAKQQISDLEDCNFHFRPAWLQRRAVAGCQRTVKDHGAAWTAALEKNVPRMMFVLLPLVALFMMPLYRHPRRLYVEHLVYFLHTQAAMYLAFIIFILLQALISRVPAMHAVSGIAGLALVVYSIWYWYASMRRAYGQGRGRTLAKLAVVGTAYLICLAVTSTVTAMISLLEG